MYWRVDFIVDDGINLSNHVCIVVAESKEEALQRYKDYAYRVLDDGKLILHHKTKVSGINGFGGILYQDIFKY